MTQRPITHIDLFPDFSAMTLSALEALCDQAFTQLEDGPLVEGLYAFYLSLTAEIEDRQLDIPAQTAPLPQEQAVEAQPA